MNSGAPHALKLLSDIHASAERILVMLEGETAQKDLSALMAAISPHLTQWPQLRQ